MECLLQWLDDLDDLYSTAALLAERVRRWLRTALVVSAALALQFAGMLLAFSRPPLAAAVACLLAVTFLYRVVVTRQATVSAP